MPAPVAAATRDLPPELARVIEDVVQQAADTLGDTLRSVILFGSAAENRVRATSDVNLLVVLTRFDPARAAALGTVLQRARAAARLGVMWLTENELTPASASFAVKFADIVRRHRVLYGDDPLTGVSIPREAALTRVRQVFLNLVIRLRASYVIDHGLEERLAMVVADAAGPLRAGSAELLELEGKPAANARAALEQVAAGWSAPKADALITAIRMARETRRLEPGRAAAILSDIIDLAGYLHRRAVALT
jgi:predicted nucleotidyltransferase